MEQNGTDIPFDVAPRRSHYRLSRRLSNREGLQRIGDDRPGVLQIIPTSDPTVPGFAKAYPGLSDVIRSLRRRLRQPLVKQTVPWPDWNAEDCEPVLHARIQTLETPWCSGIQFLTQYVQEVALIESDGLVYRFQGLSHDGRYFINLEVPLQAKTLPILLPAKLNPQGREIWDLPDAVAADYYRFAERALNAMNDGSFQPSLATLQGLIQSIRPSPSSPKAP